MVNKKLLVSVAVFIAIIGLASAGTFAYFSSSVSTTGNTITTGIIKLTPDGIIAQTTPQTIGPIVPGSFVTAYPIGSVKNDGNVAGDLTGTVNLSAVDATSGATVALPEGFTMSIKIGEEVITLHTGSNPMTSIPLASGASKQMSVTYDFHDSGNPAQGGQNVKLTYDASFMLKSNRNYTPY